MRSGVLIYYLSNTIPIDNNSLYVTQADFFAPKFDSAMILHQNGKYKLVLFQITRHKQYSKIVSKTETQNDFKVIQAILAKPPFNISVSMNDCYLYFIFAAELPDTDSISYCNTNCIGVLFFSVIQQKFFNANYNENFTICENIYIYILLFKNLFIGMVLL